MSEPITDLAEAVAELGALPMPVGPVPSERNRLKAAYIAALNEARHTHPCPATGSEYWTGCVHYDEAGHVAGVGSCHSERRADAVLAVRDAEVEYLLGEVDRRQARIAELESERHSTNEALDDAVQALRSGQVQREALAERLRAGQLWQRGRNPELVSENLVSQSELRAIFDIPLVAPWDDAEAPADGITRQIVPVQALCEDDGEHYAAVHHSYLVPRDLPESGGAR